VLNFSNVTTPYLKGTYFIKITTYFPLIFVKDFMQDLHGKHEVISIVLPFKNEVRYLTECIDSICSQTYDFWELLLVDDHSTDGSPEIAQRFTTVDKRIRYFKNPSHGVIEAMKFGFAQSTGNLITRMDGDDIKTPDNLEQLLNAVSPGVIGVGQVKYFKTDGVGAGYSRYEEWINERTKLNNSFEEVYKECVIPSPCWLVYRNDFIQAGGFDSLFYPEDYDLCFRFYKAGLKTKGTLSIIHFWRDHDIRTTRTSPHYADNRFMDLKLHYFNEIDCDPNKTQVLWGAGKKGKYIAKNWQDNNISFIWLTDNPNKIGHDIYGKVIQSPQTIEFNSNHQIVVAVAEPGGQEEIKLKTQDEGLSMFWMC
jgi:glycosyltransferase involved in cell wall biosynthesis